MTRFAVVSDGDPDRREREERERHDREHEERQERDEAAARVREHGSLPALHPLPAASIKRRRWSAARHAEARS